MSLPQSLDGIHLDIPFADYRMAAGINISTLKEMAVSPAHYLAARLLIEKEPTPAQVLGSIIHSAVLENKREYVVRPEGLDGRTKTGKEWLAAQIHPVVDAETNAIIEGMIQSVQAHPMARTILCDAKGFPEVSCWKQHPTTLLLKGRADRLTMDKTDSTVVVDLKTCKSGEAHPDRFSKTIWNWNYHRQAAFYLELFEASFFIFVAVENEPPYAVGVYNLDRETLAVGYRENERDLQRVKSCIDANDWPCYGQGISTLGLPAWAKKI